MNTMDIPEMDAITLAASQIRREQHPAVTLYWIAESIEHGRPVKLYGLSCLFCKKTLGVDFKGHIAMIVNSPVSLATFGMGITLRCKQCKQNYKVVVADSFLG